MLSVVDLTPYPITREFVPVYPSESLLLVVYSASQVVGINLVHRCVNINHNACIFRSDLL